MSRSRFEARKILVNDVERHRTKVIGALTQLRVARARFPDQNCKLWETDLRAVWFRYKEAMRAYLLGWH